MIGIHEKNFANLLRLVWENDINKITLALLSGEC